jgi:hypothetical protein
VGNAPSPILDIEELTAMGKKSSICPYFYTRYRNSNLVFTRYQIVVILLG